LIEEYYRPGDIRFKASQLRWLIAHLYAIREGYWPTQNEESGYVYMGGPQRKGSHRAHFETPVAIGAELQVRLERCKIDGLMLEFYFCMDVPDKLDLQMKLARYLNTTQKNINRRIRFALGYCCGWRRKQISYGRYCIQRRSYEKERARRLAKPGS